MATTTIPAGLVPQIWERRLWVEAAGKIFFNKFAGEEVPTGDTTSANSFANIVHINTDLTKEPGNTITFGLAYQLSGIRVSGTSTMEGNEEAISFYSQSVTLDRVRNAILWDEVLQGKKSPYNLRNAAKVLLSDWLANKIDQMTVDALVASPTKILYGGDATSDAEIDSSDVFSTALIEAACRVAKTSTPRIRPIKVNGKDRYIILAHSYQIASLRSESAWLQAQREANIRGEDNPIFNDAAGVWGSAIIFEYDKIPLYTDWGAGGETPGARALLLGAQAVLWGFGKKVYWKERVTDYDSIGVQVGSIIGVAKAKFNNKDYACIALDTYAAETYPSATS